MFLDNYCKNITWNKGSIIYICGFQEILLIMNWLKNNSLCQNIVIKEKFVFPLPLFPWCIFYNAITLCLRAIPAGFAGPKTSFFSNMPLYIFSNVQSDKSEVHLFNIVFT